MPAHTCMPHWATKVILSDLGSCNSEERRRLYIRLRSQTLSPEWGLPKSRGTILGVRIIWIIVCWGIYGVPLFMATTKSFNPKPCTKPGNPHDYILQIAFHLRRARNETDLLLDDSKSALELALCLGSVAANEDGFASTVFDYLSRFTCNCSKPQTQLRSSPHAKQVKHCAGLEEPQKIEYLRYILNPIPLRPRY